LTCKRINPQSIRTTGRLLYLEWVSIWDFLAYLAFWFILLSRVLDGLICGF